MTDIVTLTKEGREKPVRKKCVNLIEKLKAEGWKEKPAVRKSGK